LALYHNHEQLNDIIKEAVGAVGLTDNVVALIRWMIAAPEIARLVNVFDEHNDKWSGKHHEQSAGVEAEFKKDVHELTGIVQGMGNPFLYDGDDPDTKLVMDSSVVQTLYTVEQIGKAQYDASVHEWLVLCKTTLTDTIPKNYLALF